MRISDWSSDVCSSVLLAAPLAVETQWRAGRRKEFAARGSRAAAGKLFSPDGCSHEARGAATPPPGFTTRQGRLGPNRSERRSRSEETRVGKEGVRKCRSWWSASH